MGTEQIEDQVKGPLRLVAPEVYEALMETLADLHLHPYDVKADAVKKANGLLLIISYGQGFSQTESHFFSYGSLEQMNDDVTAFFNIIKDSCQKALMYDYFETMNPAMNKKSP